MTAMHDLLLPCVSAITTKSSATNHQLPSVYGRQQKPNWHDFGILFPSSVLKQSHGQGGVHVLSLRIMKSHK
uniref:Uncharacterized protein n=1 Tax=Oryza brachyantha TaxID=4533 RepID=J3MCY3_ORYBR